MPATGLQREVRVTPAPFGWTGRFQAMGSPCEILLEGGKRADAERWTRLAATEAWRIEDKFSRYLPDSALSRVNDAAGRPIETDAETARLLDFAAELFELSDGRFDVTSGVLRQVWTFDGSDRVPTDTDVSDVLAHVGWERVNWDGETIRLPAGMEIDFGGIGKEYAVDRVAGMLREESAQPGLVNFGGDLAIAAAPRDREGWVVGIDPAGGAATSASKPISIRRGALATSGDARRFLEKDGVRYGHILDPSTGWPVPGSPSSITVAADTCTQAGMLSTLAMLQGAGAEAFLDAEGIRYWSERR